MDLYNGGFLPEAIINYLALLGWSSANNKELFTMEELIEEFDPKRINKSPSTYDVKKLKWVNAHYMKKLSMEDLKKITIPHLEVAYDIDKSEEWLEHLLRIYQPHLSYGKQIVEEVKLFFEDDLELSDDCKEIMKDESVENTIKVFKEQLESVEFTVENINACINATKELAGVKGKMLYMPIRIKTTGIMHGPELADTIYLLGREKVLNKLK